MGTTFRQDLKRFDEIEPDDSITFHVERIVRTERTYNLKDGKWTNVQRTHEREGGYHLTGKAIRQEDDGAWLVRESGARKQDHLVRVDLKNFWALRKAPGRGKNPLARFALEDSIVTCQICEGIYLGNTGILPHHGYRRPGWGVQTDSCEGALKTPYAIIRGLGQEVADPRDRVPFVARDLIPPMIDSLRRAISRLKKDLAMLRAGGPPTLPGIDAWRPIDQWTPADAKTREPILKGATSHDDRFDYGKRLEYEIKRVKQSLETTQWRERQMQARFDEWRPGGDGVLVAPAKMTK